MNKHVKLFYKAYERKVNNENPNIKKHNRKVKNDPNELFVRCLRNIMREFAIKLGLKENEYQMLENKKILLHKNGFDVDFEDMVTHLEYNATNELFENYIDHKLTAEENGLKALNYEEFIRLENE
jgi:hypothetical protein